MNTKEEYIDSLAAELKQWGAEADLLTAKAEHAAADVKLKYQEDIEYLRGKQIAAEVKIKELQEASGDAWESVKETADNMWADLRTGVSAVVDRFK